MSSFTDIRNSVYPDFTDGASESLSDERSLNIVCRVFTKLCKAYSHNSKIASHALNLIRERDFNSLLDLKVDPSSYDDGEAFANDYQISSFFSKCEDLPGFDDELRFSATLKATADAEAQNRRTTIIWNTMSPTPFVRDVLFEARDIIWDILGDAPIMDNIYEKASYGPGSSSSCSGDSVSLPGKLCAALDVTEEAIPYFRELMARRPEFRNFEVDQLVAPMGPQPVLDPVFNIVDYDTYIVAPKRAKVGRGICIAQHCNIPLQKGAGSEMRRLLKAYHHGYCLDSQHVVNQMLARIGSITSMLATMDVKTASDCIITVLVEFLLPRMWFEFLDSLRAKKTLYPCGTLHTNYKFSSMGNGYTFELESIIFFALALATARIGAHPTSDEIGRRCVFSFGDDIICSSSSVNDLTKVLAYCGFQVNQTKSFTGTIKFRESCGADYWDGGNIRPFFLRKLPRNETDLIKLANAIRHYATRRGCGGYHDIRLLPCWRSVVDVLKAETKDRGLPVGPSTLNDQCLWATGEEVGGNVVKPFQYAGITYAGSVKCRGRWSRRRYPTVAVTTRLMMSRESTHFMQGNSYLRIVWRALDKCHGELRETSPCTSVIRGQDGRHLKRSYVAVEYSDDTLHWI